MELTDQEYDLIEFCIHKHLIYFDEEDKGVASKVLSKIREIRES